MTMTLKQLHTEVEFEGRKYACTVVPYDRRDKDQRSEAHRLPGIWMRLPDDDLDLEIEKLAAEAVGVTGSCMVYCEEL
jgi:hypothetical protein